MMTKPRQNQGNNFLSSTFAETSFITPVFCLYNSVPPSPSFSVNLLHRHHPHVSCISLTLSRICKISDRCLELTERTFRLVPSHPVHRLLNTSVFMGKMLSPTHSSLFQGSTRLSINTPLFLPIQNIPITAPLARNPKRAKPGAYLETHRNGPKPKKFANKPGLPSRSSIWTFVCFKSPW